MHTGSDGRLTGAQKSELGKYAHEDRMPDWLVDLLKREGQVVEHGTRISGRLLPGGSLHTDAWLTHTQGLLRS